MSQSCLATKNELAVVLLLLYLLFLRLCVDQNSDAFLPKFEFALNFFVVPIRLPRSISCVLCAIFFVCALTEV